MAPVKLPIGYKCRLFNSSQNSLNLGEYNYGHSDGCSTKSIPLGIPAKGEVNPVAAGPSAEHIILISTDDDRSTLTPLICVQGSSLALPICIEGKSNVCASSMAPKKKKIDTERCSRCGLNRHFQDVSATKKLWTEAHLDAEGVLVAIKCKMCSAINGKLKLIVSKWDNLEKHMEKRRALVDLP